MKSVLCGSLILSFALLLGRLSGFLRELLLAARYGVSEAADAAVLILTLPDLMVGILLAGGFNAALVPALKKRTFAARQSLLIVTATVTFTLVAALSFAIYLYPSVLMGVLAPELQTQSAGPISRAFRISLLAIPLSTLIGVSVAYLNTVGRFAYPGLSVLLFNTVLCVYLFSSTLSSFGLIGFAAALVVANLFRLGLQVLGMREMFRWPKEAFAPIDPGFLRIFLFGVASYALVVGVGVIFRTIHAHGGDGLLSAFNYAIKLFELPTALMVAPVATVFLPLLSAEAQLASDSFEQKFLAACGAAWALSTSAALLGHQFMAFLVARIYGYGSMTAAGQADVAAVAKIMMFGLPAFALFQMGSVALNAKGLTHRVFWATSFGLGTGIAIARLAQYLDVPNHAALGFAAFQWAAALAVLSSLDLTQGLKKTLARTALTSAGQAALVVLPIAAAAKYFISDSNVLLGAALLLATGLTALISLTYIRPLKAIRVHTD